MTRHKEYDRHMLSSQAAQGKPGLAASLCFLSQYVASGLTKADDKDYLVNSDR